jgi:tripartite-type tricarboxylate transporter receptor subunit TctC
MVAAVEPEEWSVMAKTVLVFDVVFNGEPAAGLDAYTNRVRIEADYEPGGERDEFSRHMQQALSDWFAGARVSPVAAHLQQG